VRGNHRPAVAVSELAPNQVILCPGEPAPMACPICGRWRRIKRHMLWPHRAHDGVTRCPGSGQRVVIDLAPGEWLARLDAARRSVRRATSMQRATEQAFRQANARSQPESGAV